MRRSLLAAAAAAAPATALTALLVATPASADGVGSLILGRGENRSFVVLTVTVHGNTSGRPTVCVLNNGPHNIRIVRNHIRDEYRGTRLRFGGGDRVLRPGASYCRTHAASVRVRWSWATLAVVDQETAAYAHTSVAVGP